MVATQRALDGRVNSCAYVPLMLSTCTRSFKSANIRHCLDTGVRRYDGGVKICLIVIPAKAAIQYNVIIRIDLERIPAFVGMTAELMFALSSYRLKPESSTPS